MKRSYTLPYSQTTTQESQLSQEMPYKKARTYKSRVSKSYKRSYKPKLYKSPYSMVYPIERACQVVMGLNPSLGFYDFTSTNTSLYFGLSFALEGVTPWLGGSVQTEVGIPSSAELQSLFDKYRIKKVEVEVFYGHNSSESTQPYLPVITQALDFDSVNGTNDLNEYAGAQTRQFGNNNGAHKFKLYNPTIAQSVGSDAPLIAVIGAQKVSPWLDTAAPGINHYGMRFQVSNFGSSTNALVGRFIFRFKITYEFKCPR